jgi:hypothetical protein
VVARKKQGSSAGLVLALIALAAVLWGAERWRRHAARRAGGSQSSRITALTRCVFGADGAQVLRSPSAARTRIRLLALSTPAEPSITWIDRCVPIARSFARHAGEVDDTRPFVGAPSHLREHSRTLLRELERTALVWRLRSGDPEVDVARIVDAFIRVRAELDLGAETSASADSLEAPQAPAPAPLPEPTIVPTQGLEPSSIGTPRRFFAGTPLPGLASVSLEGGLWRVRVLAAISSHVSVLRPSGLLRIDARTGPTDDGLTDLRWIRPGMETEGVRVAPVDDALDGLHVDLDGYATAGDIFWMAQWTPAVGVVFGRHSPRRGWASFTLANAPPEALERSRHATQGRTRAFDDHVAIAPLGSGSVVAYTTRDASNERTTLSFAAALRDSDQPTISRLGETRVAGRTPELHFCPRSNGKPWLFVAANSEWLAFEVDERGPRQLVRSTSPTRGTYSERAAVRCDDDRVVMFALERGRSSPMILCEQDRCRSVNPPIIRTPLTMPPYATRTANGRSLIHSDWPVAVAIAGNTTIFARAAGSIVAVSVRGSGDTRWDTERVVFDASAQQHGIVVEGLALYEQGEELLLAIAVPDGLRLLRSTDRGATWR